MPWQTATRGGVGRFVVRFGEVLYKATLYSVLYGDGPVILTGDSNDFSRNCSGGITPLPPTDISSKFQVGMNKVLVTLKDKCGFIEGSSALWLLP